MNLFYRLGVLCAAAMLSVAAVATFGQQATVLPKQFASWNGTPADSRVPAGRSAGARNAAIRTWSGGAQRGAGIVERRQVCGADAGGRVCDRRGSDAGELSGFAE